MYYVYLLRCGDNSLYCGYTDNLTKRISAHKSGRGAKYTKSHQPVFLAYFEEYETKSEAMSREYFIKKMTKDKKEELLKKFSLTNHKIGDILKLKKTGELVIQAERK